MKKYTFLLSLLFVVACQKQTEFVVPSCIQNVIDSTQKPSRITQYEYEKQDYYVVVYGVLDNGFGNLLNNQCDTICTFTDDLTCYGLKDFWQKSKFVKVVLE